MDELLSHPAIHGGIAPFVVSLILATALQRTRLSGLAVTAGFITAVYLAGGLAFIPLNATRKIVLLGCAAPVIGLLLDIAFRPTRVGLFLIAVAGGLGAVWVFWSVLIQKELLFALLLGGGVAAFVAVVIAIGLVLARDPVSAGATGLTLGLGTGISAMLGASLLYAVYGTALGAGAGAYLLVQMVTGRKIAAGATLMLPVVLTSGLLGAGAMMLAELPWYALPVLALVPVATLVPLPEKMPVWQQAFLRSGSAMIVAGIAFALTWHFAGNAMS